MGDTTKRIETYLKWRNESAWRLLAADQAPIILGLLQTTLFENERTLPSSIFHERINRELEELRIHGLDLPQTAQAYISNWLSAGFIERSFPPDANEEIYELTAASIESIRFIEKLVNKRQIATESRLSLVIEQLVHICEQTDTDKERRIARLKKERKRIEAEIIAVKAGKNNVLDDARALERTQEIIVLADELVNDFRQVRDNFVTLNRKFREELMNNNESRGTILKEIFSGIDVIAESDSGKSFSAFWRLLTDPQQSAELEESTDTLLSRPFSRQLAYKDRCFLAQLIAVLLDQGGSVHNVLQSFARSLKHYVQSREFQEQRRLLSLLQDTQRIAFELKDTISPTTIILPNFSLTSCKIFSCGQLSLHNPDVDKMTDYIELAKPANFSLDTLKNWINESEIDFHSLRKHILTLLEQHSQISIADILKHYPAEQGLGSIIGYISLGVKHGVLSQHSEKISWSDKTATIPKIYFIKEKYHDIENA